MSLDSLLDRLTREAADRRAAALEAALMDHDEVIEVDALGRRCVYSVPSWRRRPLRRARIAWLRRRRRAA